MQNLTHEQKVAVELLISGQETCWATAINSENYSLLSSWADQGWFTKVETGSEISIFEVTAMGLSMLEFAYGNHPIQ